MKNICYAFILFFVANSCNAGSFSCSFENWYSIEKGIVTHENVNQSVEVIDMKTSQKTISLDGRYRAVNGVNWTHIKSTVASGFTGDVFVSDHGESLLLGKTKYKIKSGFLYEASIHSNLLGTVYTMIGTCFVDM